MNSSVSGNIVDVVRRTIKTGTVFFENGHITEIKIHPTHADVYIIPGFVDAHIHIESSMMVPSEFARHSCIHGTVACICDPHEIANVCGVNGIDYMINNARLSTMKFFFGAPSCVPATSFDTAGAVIDSHTIENLLKRKDIYFLAEMMNYPGVVEQDVEVHAKLNAAYKNHKPIDGHAPELMGDDLKVYASAGISTDHECMTIAEAEEKIALGMKVQIREGSAAKNFDDLLPLLQNNADNIMFCSDDKHPEDLLQHGHINTLVKRAIAAGYNPVDVIRVASFNPVKHYNLPVGLLQHGDPADFLIVNNLSELQILSTYVNGKRVAQNGEALSDFIPLTESINNFRADKLTTNDIRVEVTGEKLRVIVVDDGQLFTHSALHLPEILDGNVISDTHNDILKLVVYNRYHPSKPAVGFIKNVGLKRGALASTVSHDSHNIVAVGTTDEDIINAINQLIDCKGGIVACDKFETCLLPLPVAGLMSTEPGEVIAEQYKKADALVKSFGSTLKAPFMTIAFMSLLVIPKLKLSDKGLFDGKTYTFTNLME